jgi:uncharacterized lipoprotein YajG
MIRKNKISYSALKNNFSSMKLLSILLFSTIMLASCGTQGTPVVVQPKAETNTVDIGNKTITTITGSYVQPIR